MKKQFCCDASRTFYEDYYVNQSGSGVPVFQGTRMQRGHGLGSVFSGLFRSALPLIARGAKALGKRALQASLQVANDVAEGSSFGDAAKRRFTDGIKTAFTDANVNLQSGSGRRKRERVQEKKKKKKKGRLIDKRKRDIFD